MEERAHDQVLENTSTSQDGDQAPGAGQPVRDPIQGMIPANWFEFVTSASDEQIKNRFGQQVNQIILNNRDFASGYCHLALLEPSNSIDDYDLDRLYRALTAVNPNKMKNVFLMIVSPGGNIEPAYRISKLCKLFARDKFVVAIPRKAKSAATLLSLGADEIHMGLLGELGPIDPQLGGLPALGVQQALKTIASLVERHPGSSEMFARYLSHKVTVEQIGYCERIAESAVQYAERLLGTKPHLAERKAQIAKLLTEAYKHHSFVIDSIEAQELLGKEWVKVETPELLIAEQIYELYDTVVTALRVRCGKRLLVTGRFDTDGLIYGIPD